MNKSIGKKSYSNLSPSELGGGREGFPMKSYNYLVGTHEDKVNGGLVPRDVSHVFSQSKLKMEKGSAPNSPFSRLGSQS